MIPPAEPSPSFARRFNDWWWFALPGAARRLSVVAYLVLRDGDYFAAWPAIGAVAPPAALTVGLLAGALHPGSAFSSSLIVLGISYLLSGMSAALGIWFLLGFATADLTRIAGAPPIGEPSVLGSVVSYLILLQLLVIVPMIAAALRAQLGRRIGRTPAGRTAGFTIAGVVQVVLTIGWAQSAAFLIRPVWSLSGQSPDVGSISTLQHSMGVLVVATTLGIVLRTVLTLRAGVVRPAASRPFVRFRVQRRLPWPARAALQGLFFTLLLGGLIDSAVAAVVAGVIMIGLAVLRCGILPRMPDYVRLVNHVPALLRALCCSAAGYFLAAVVVSPAIQRGESSFVPMLIAALPPLALAAVLLPAAPPQRTSTRR